MEENLKINLTGGTLKVDKEDPRARKHYVKTICKDGKDTKIWECGLCKKEFRFQYTLMRHIPTHTDVRAFHCESCPKSFRQLSTLAQHRATHLNKRPFYCDVCNKCFNRVSTLISHRKIHSDDKRHICHICKKGFHQKGNLRNHIYTHTNARPYKCDICGKGFNQKSNLVCHKTSTHKKKQIFQCELCSQSFLKPQMYNSHMEISHNVKKPPKKVEEPGKQNAYPGKRFSFLTKSSSEGINSLRKPIQDAANVAYELSLIQNGEDGTECVIKSIRNIPKVQMCYNSKPVVDRTLDRGGVLTEVLHKPTFAMSHLKELGEIPFVILYQPGESHPKICKAELEEEKYFLVDPSKSDIKNYISQHSKTTRYQFPVVSTIIQKLDENKRLQTLVIPAGQPAELVESKGMFKNSESKNKILNSTICQNFDEVKNMFLPNETEKCMEKSNECKPEAGSEKFVNIESPDDSLESLLENFVIGFPEDKGETATKEGGKSSEDEFFNELVNMGFQNIGFSGNEGKKEKSTEINNETLPYSVSSNDCNSDEVNDWSPLLEMTVTEDSEQELSSYGDDFLEITAEEIIKREDFGNIDLKQEPGLGNPDYSSELDCSSSFGLSDCVVDDVLDSSSFLFLDPLLMPEKEFS